MNTGLHIIGIEIVKGRSLDHSYTRSQLVIDYVHEISKLVFTRSPVLQIFI